jgi:hypothetical protein
MKLTTKIIVLTCIVIGLSGTANAQQYLYEIGPTAGASFYSGDANNYAYFQKPQSVFGISLRRNFNFRTALKLDLLIAHAAYDPILANLPDQSVVSKKINYFDANAHLEYSFFSYSDSFEYKDTHRFTPYIFSGIGTNFVNGSIMPYLPIGVGIKYKIFHRWSVGLEYSANMMFKDNFERDPSLNNPYKANGSILKNNDWVSYLKLNLMFDFWERPCKCNKNK